MRVAAAVRAAEIDSVGRLQAFAGVGHLASASSVRIRTLGEFSVLRFGEPIPAAQWQSKKSRDLLKLLIAKRGRPLHREAIVEILWIGESADSASNRFSVALSRARSALDPERRLPNDHFIVMRDDVVVLDTSHIDVDVELFLALAGRGLVDGVGEDRMPTLTSAYDIYRGDFLESEAYEDWAIPLREEARAAFISVALALGDFARDRSDYEAAVAYYSSVLDKDRYAEHAHFGLVRSAQSAGRHGEARRHYETYANRMIELEIKAAPFPSQRSPSIKGL